MPRAKQGLLLLTLLLLVAKLLLASALPLFGDEAFYWQCAQRPALAYADHPPATALLVRLGTAVVGDTTLGVRLPFLLLGALFPLVVFHLARPLVGPKDAYLAACASLLVPGLGGQMGSVAVPDVPLLFLTALYLLALERATRTEELRGWVLAGLLGALGLTTHYRFVLAPAAAGMYLLVAGRRHLRGPGPWISLGLLTLGLLPALVYNLQHELAPLRYYLAGRHGPTFQPVALARFLGVQAALVTPLLFLGLLGTLVVTLGRARRGDDRAALLSAFALLPLVLFFLASPFERSGLAQGHWPMPAYVPLLVCLPATARSFVAGGARRRARRGLVLLAPLIGAGALLGVSLEVATGVFGTSIRKPFAGWREAHAATVRHLEPGSVVVADNYKLAANLEFLSAGRLRPFVLDHEKNRLHGRAPQLRQWGIGEAALHQRRGESAVVILGIKELPSRRRAAWRARAARKFARFERLEEVHVVVGRRTLIFEVYRGERILASPAPAPRR